MDPNDYEYLRRVICSRIQELDGGLCSAGLDQLVQSRLRNEYRSILAQTLKEMVESQLRKTLTNYNPQMDQEKLTYCHSDHTQRNPDLYLNRQFRPSVPFFYFYPNRMFHHPPVYTIATQPGYYVVQPFQQFQPNVLSNVLTNVVTNVETNVLSNVETNVVSTVDTSTAESTRTNTNNFFDTSDFREQDRKSQAANRNAENETLESSVQEENFELRSSINLEEIPETTFITQTEKIESNGNAETSSSSDEVNVKTESSNPTDLQPTVQKPNETDLQFTDATGVQLTDTTGVKLTDATDAQITDATDAQITYPTDAQITDTTGVQKTGSNLFHFNNSLVEFYETDATNVISASTTTTTNESTPSNVQEESSSKEILISSPENVSQDTTETIPDIDINESIHISNNTNVEFYETPETTTTTVVSGMNFAQETFWNVTNNTKVEYYDPSATKLRKSRILLEMNSKANKLSVLIPGFWTSSIVYFILFTFC